MKAFSRPVKLLLVDELVLLSSKAAFRSEFETWRCDEREEVTLLAPASVERLEVQGQMLFSCISAIFFVVVIMARIDSNGEIARSHLMRSSCRQEYQG